MTRVFASRFFLIPATVLALVLTLGGQNASAQTKPFKIKGVGIADFIPSVPGTSAEHFAVGTGTGLGCYYGEGALTLIGYTSPNTAAFKSTTPFVFYGEEATLACDYGITPAGQVTLFPAGGNLVYAVFVANFTAVPAKSTGKFKKITGGGFEMIAVSAPFVFGSTTPVPYAWTGEGSFNYAKGK